MPATRPLLERFWEKVEKHDHGCWLWTGALAAGYGCLGGGPGKPLVKAHRLSYELHKGPIPDGAKVLHTCDTPPCVRPDHLYVGTQRDNALDRERRGRGNHATGDRSGARVHPERLKRGDDHWTRKARPWRGSKNVKAKLTPGQVAEIKQKYATGEYYQKELAYEYGVTQGTISCLTLGKTWR
jgi:hypothetical protein